MWVFIMNNYYFDCECSDFNHTFRFVYDQTDNAVWLEVRLNQYLPWYKRVWVALKYIFKCRPAYGHYDTTILRHEDLGKLDDLLNRVVEYDRALTKEEAQDLLQYIKSYPGYDEVSKGAWICCLQGTNPEQWVIDSINHKGIFVRVYNHMKVTSE